MAYLQGFILAVPQDKRADYQKVAEESMKLFMDYGARRIVECWQDDVPAGETTDMFRAVQAHPDENIIFSWIEWASKESFDKAHEEMGSDERMEQPVEMPFDGARMIYAGFDILGESGSGSGDKAGYVHGYVAPVKKGRRQPFADMCQTVREIALDCGALRAVDSLAADVAQGKITDFNRAVKADPDEAIAFGVTQWASREAYEQGAAKMREHKHMPGGGASMPMDGKRMIYGGFKVILDTR